MQNERPHALRTPTVLVIAMLLAGAAIGCDDGEASAPPTHPDATAAASSAALHRAEPAGGDVTWGPVPPGFPPGAELALVQGDPTAIGAAFTIRLRMPNDYVLPPHFHPEDEHVTVLAGRFDVGLGTVVDAASAVASLQRNGFITAPKQHNHWGIARGQTVVQVHGIGPFQTTFVDEQGAPIPQ